MTRCFSDEVDGRPAVHNFPFTTHPQVPLPDEARTHSNHLLAGANLVPNSIMHVLQQVDPPSPGAPPSSEGALPTCEHWQPEFRRMAHLITNHPFYKAIKQVLQCQRTIHLELLFCQIETFLLTGQGSEFRSGYMSHQKGL